MKRFNITLLLLAIGISFSVGQIPTDGLVASYPFNGNANDESGNGNDGTVHGAVLTKDRFGNENNALEFDGVDDFVTLQNIIPKSEASISYWINTDRIGVEGQVVVYNSSTVDNGFGSIHDALETHTGISQKGGYFNFKNGNINTSPQVHFTDSIVMKSNSWLHITLTYDINDSVKYYVNGEKLNAQVLEGLTFGDHTPIYTYIGRPSMSTRFFDGSFDDLFIYDRVLSETEIAQLYGDFHSIENGGLVLSLPFDGNADDESGNGYDAIAYGATLTEDRFGNTMSAYYFDGIDDTIAIQKPLFDMTEMSIAFWVKSEMEGNTRGNIFCDGTVNTGGDDFLINVSSSTIGMRADKGVGFNYENTSPAELSGLDLTNDWHHIVWSFDQISSEVYLDGKLLVSIPKAASNATNHDPTPIIGAREVWTDKDKFFKGSIDDFKIFNNKVTPEEVTTLYKMEETAQLHLNWTTLKPKILYDFNSSDWYHIAYTKVRDGQGGIFINGDSIGPITWRNHPFNHNKLNIAAAYYIGYYDFFEGSIDEIKVSYGIKTEAELKSYINSNQQFEKDASTYQIWRFDEGSGSSFSNVDNSLNGTIHGGPQWVDGKFGKAIAYNGVDQRSQVSLNLPEYGVTYEFWVRFDGGIKEQNQSIIQAYGMHNTPFNVSKYIPEEKDYESSLEFVATEMEVLSNEEISYPVMVKGFENILTAQYTVTWDPAVLEYQGVQDFGLKDLSESSFHLYDEGTLTFSWNAEDLIAETVSDSSVIFNIQFKAIGAGGTLTAVQFSDDPTVLEVADADGNVVEASYLDGSVQILDQVTIGGYLRTQKREPVVGAEVMLSGGREAKTISDESGWYSFDVEADKTYTITPAYDTEADDGVTTIDIVVMHWHILAKKFMMSDADLVASDVNLSKSLTTLDLAKTRSVILHTSNSFGNRRSVEFINHEYKGSPDVFEYSNYTVANTDQDKLDINFTAVKLGDASTNWNPNKESGARIDGLQEIEIQLEQGLAKGNRVRIPLRSADFQELVGIQFTLEWDPGAYRLDKLIDGQLHFEFNVEEAKEGRLTLSWNTNGLEGVTFDKEEVLSTFEFIKLKEADPQLEITSTATPALAYNASLEAFRIAGKEKFQDLNKSFFKLYPNPATDRISITGIDEPKDTNYSIRNAIGELVQAGRLTRNSVLDVENLKVGVYVIQFVGHDSKLVNLKFLKQ